MNTDLLSASNRGMQAERACDSGDESEVEISDVNAVNEEQMFVTYTGRGRLRVWLGKKLISSVMGTARTLRLFARSV